MLKDSLKLFYLYFIFSLSIIYAENISSNQTGNLTPHVSLIIHEELLNDFFKAMGRIKGNGRGASIDYSWELKNPRIDIKVDEAIFSAKINAKTDLFSITKDVEGTVDVTYDKADNIIQIVIDKANVILDFDLFGNNVVLAEIDIAKYFSKPLRLDGPKSFNNQIDYKLPTGEMKKMSVTTKLYELILLEDAIQLVTILDFKTIATDKIID